MKKRLTIEEQRKIVKQGFQKSKDKLSLAQEQRKLAKFDLKKWIKPN